MEDDRIGNGRAPIRMPRFLRAQMWEEIEQQLSIRMPGKQTPHEIATTLNSILFYAFEKGREADGHTFNLNPEFVGEYIVDSEDPFQMRVYSHQGTEACSPIDIRPEKRRSILGRTIRRGIETYVPDTRKDPDHLACSPIMGEGGKGGTEIALLAWSKPYTSGPYKGISVPLGLLDVDLKVIDAFPREDLDHLKKVWAKYSGLIFPGEPQFQITPELEVRYEFMRREGLREAV